VYPKSVGIAGETDEKGIKELDAIINRLFDIISRPAKPSVSVL